MRNYYCLCFIYTFKCTSSCDICGFSCSPQCNEKMDFNLAKKLIEDASKNDIPVIAFTGGEPFLYYDEMIELIKLCNKNKLQVTITTNCYWADNYDKTLKILQELKKYSVRSIKISLDAFHLQYISTDNVKNLLKASKAVNLRIVIGCTITREKKLKHILDSFGEELTDIAIYEHKCYPLGRAKENIPSKDIYLLDKVDGFCRDGGILTITPNGDTFPCGSMWGMTEKRKLGNAKKDSLNELLNRSNSNSYNMKVLYGNLNKVLNTAVENNLMDKIGHKFVDTCHACHGIFNNLSSEELKTIFGGKDNDKI